MRRYADEVVICYDSDEAGRRATQRAIPLLKNAGLQVRVITVPGNKDPDEFFRSDPKDGVVRFKRLIQESGNDTEYRLSVIRAKYDLTSEDGKKRYLQEAVSQVLGTLRDRIELDLYAGRLSGETGVGKDSIMASAQKAASQAARQRKREEVRAQREVAATRTVANPEKKRHMRAALAEEGILAYLFRNQDQAEALERRIPPEKWITPWGRRVYTLMLGKTKLGEVTLSGMAEDLTPDELSELSRVLVERRQVPPSWEDVEGFSRILEEEALGDPEHWKNSSPQDLRQYLEKLKQRK